MTSVLNPLRHQQPATRRLLVGEMAGLLAGASTQTTLAWWIAHSGGSGDLARYGAAMAICAMVALPLMSPLGDRWAKHRVVRYARGVLLIEALALAAMAFTHVYSWPMLCLCGALSAVSNAALMPAQASMLPELVSADRLPEAIRLRRGFQAAGGLMGPALSGALLALHGIAAAMMGALLLMVVAAGMAMRLESPQVLRSSAASAGWLGDMRAGLRAKWCVPVDRWWTLAGALMMVFFLPTTGLLLPLRLQSLGLSGGWFGACGAALSLGVMAGVAGLADALIRRLDRVRAIAVALGICGCAMGAAGLCDHALALVALFALMGICMSVTQLVGQTHRMLAVPEAFRSRMAAAQLTLAHLAATVAPAVAGALLTGWCVDAVYLWMAAGFLVSGGLLLAVPDFRPFLRLDHARVKNWYGQQYPEAFMPRP
ncbi:MFS family permease [Pelomonas saccharophila]|uniref:MFS family permease n=1 Tax=Roseateles saccharophilus TaxID=304 RepID=A0ABU1YLX1_ROSSA|nr:MFS transporter [Roseateles saccharophilus]MDR7269851.1 MFS family permease [Roseateles saccharophilus]